MKADLDVTFRKEERFKETPVGEIPKGWEVVKLKDIALTIMGQSPPFPRIIRTV